MGNAHLRLLAVWVSLSALFITSSLAAASSDASVFCIVRPSFPVAEIYLSPNLESAPLYMFSHSYDYYLCTDPVPLSALTQGVRIRFLRTGSSTSEFWDANAVFYDYDTVMVTRLEYHVPEYNKLYVVYVARGVGYIAVDDYIPKSSVSSYVSISGPVVFLNPDPVLRMFLRAESGKIDVRHYEISGVTGIVPIRTAVRFATCNLRIVDFSASLTTIDGRNYVTGRFSVFDGDSPLFIPNLRVQIGDQVISPQYSSMDMSYQFFAPYSEDAEAVIIYADVPGCSHFEHEEYLSLHESNDWAGWILAGLVILVAVGIYILKKRR